jgi:hypothetical protein
MNRGIARIRGLTTAIGATASNRVILVLLAAILCTNGCGYLRTAATGSLVRDVYSASLEQDDPVLVSQALPTYLLLMEALLKSDPDNAEMLRATAEGYTGYGVLVEAEEPQRAAIIFARARDYGTKALVARRPDVRDLLEGPFSEFAKIDKQLRKEDVGYVFWAASSWGAWIGANLDSMAALADLPRVIHLMHWVLEQDESFRNGGAHLFLGIYHAALPPMLGGKPELALSHFERALELTNGKDLMVRVQMARFYARQIFDRELFVEQLELVLQTPANTAPKLTLQNAAAKRLAQTLLKDVDVYF